MGICRGSSATTSATKCCGTTLCGIVGILERIVERKHKAVLGILSATVLAFGAIWFLEVRMNKQYALTPAPDVFSHRTMQVAAPKETWEKLFATLEAFSKRNGFTAHIRRIKKDVDLILVHLMREDVSIGGGNIVKVDQFLWQFHFNPEKGGSMAIVEELIPTLEQELSTVQGISVEVKRDDG